MSHSDQHDSPNLEDLTPEEANRIIHSHRKVRYGVSPCLLVSKSPPMHSLSRVILVLPLAAQDRGKWLHGNALHDRCPGETQSNSC